MNKLIAISLLLLSLSAHAETPALLCDPALNPIEPDMRLREDDFTLEAIEADERFLQESLPDWVNRQQENGQEIDLKSGEIGMAYLNRLNRFRGFILRQKALAEQENGAPGKATEAFCSFLYSTPIMD